MLRARALEQALRMLIDAAVQTACKIAEDGDRRWHVVDLVCATNDAEKLLAVDPPPSGAKSQERELLIAMARDWTNPAVVRDAPERVPHVIEQLIAALEAPPSGASPQATGGYIHHSITDWIPTPECDCDRCTSARKSAPKPTGGASPQAETSASEVAYEHMLAQRGLDRETDTICVKCYGSGVRAYGNTATWRGGIGGSTITMDVCDRCWGSGNDTKRWPSHRLSPAPVSPVEPEPPEELPCYCDIPSHILDLGCPRHQAPQCEPEPPKTWSLEIINRTGFTVEPEPCVWREDEDGIWETSCGASWVFIDGSPSENNTKFCHNCGHPVQPVAYVERFDDDEDEAGAPLKVER